MDVPAPNPCAHSVRTLAQVGSIVLLLAASGPSLASEAEAAPEPVDSSVDASADSPAEIAAEFDAELVLRGMTYVGERGKHGEFVVRAREARFRPDSNMVLLEDVRVIATDPDERRNFDVRCDEGELDIESNDFMATGDVRGATGDGQRYRASWVRYDHEKDLLYSDAPVLMEDETGTFQGDGFRYYADQRRFQLTGNVRMVQAR
jgi:LPS export ABC transporter protein LptC